jgi:hypothetical protein
MQIPNLTSDMGTVVGWTNTTIKDTCFTSVEWAQFADTVNKQMSQTLTVGLIIGAVAGVIGLFAAIKFMEWKKQKEWEKYGKS